MTFWTLVLACAIGSFIGGILVVAAFAFVVQWLSG